MKKKLKIGILWADPYNKNLGVGALAYSSAALLTDVIKEKNLEAEISFVCSSKNRQGDFDHKGNLIAFHSFPILDYLKPKSIIQLFLLSKRFQTRKLLSFDYVFDISAGDSFADIYGPKRFDQMLNTKKFFNILGKKLVLLPQTIGPFKDKQFEKQAFDAMHKMEMVISRDKQSYEYTSAFLPENKIKETIDVAFYLPFLQKTLDNGRLNVGINISGLLWHGGYTKNNQFEMKTVYRELILKTIAYFSAQTQVQVHLVPHVIPENNPVEDDYSTCEQIRDEYIPGAIVAPRFETPMEAKSYISGMDFFTGARMHACIGAFSAGVPVYLMAYSRKFNGLFGDTLGYKWMGDCVNETTEVVFNRMVEAFENRTLLRQQIATSLKEVARPRLELLKQVLSEIIK